MRSCSAIRKEAGIFGGSFPQEGEAFAYGGRTQNLNDLKAVFARLGSLKT